MKGKTVCLIMLLPFCVLSAQANDISVSNVVLRMQDVDEKTVFVEFDLSWENSWRNELNHDAAWVFIKFRAPGSNNWEHALLSTNSADHAPTPAGGVVAAVADGMGAFIYSAASRTADVDYARTRLLWDYGGNGYSFAKGDLVDVSVHAIEMVYVAEGSFYLGSGGTENGCFTGGGSISGARLPFPITSENALLITNAPGHLWGTSTSGTTTIGPAGELPTAFPKGFRAFYCMKYLITQGQYAEFLNHLTGTQQSTRSTTAYYGVNRHRIRFVDGTYIAERPDRACNYLAWMDLAAYADWTGLRPMTEFEFEKACRGFAAPVENEYPWGTIAVRASGDITLNIESGAEEDGAEWVASSFSGGGAWYQHKYVIGGDGGQGPLRVGIFATNGATRVRSGASYWGILELGGNLWDRAVTVGNAEGRLFAGSHGDGKLSSSGNATNSDWPGFSAGHVTGATGAGQRGCTSDFAGSTGWMRTSDRYYAANTTTSRFPGNGNHLGGRAVRTAP